MTNFEIYSLILCLIVFVLLVGLFTYMLMIIVKQRFLHIMLGVEDDSILQEFNKDSTKKQRKASKVFDVILSVFLCLIFGALFSASLYINCTQNAYFDNVATYRVVLSPSMETKNEKNTYLFDNEINNQLGTFDLIATYKIPPVEELKLYDVVVYELDGVLVIHRIVGIEKPNSSHPNETYFLLQGDAVSTPDRFPVLYEQMKGIYKGFRIPFIGSFILFLQSPAGWLCMLLVVGSIIFTPILERKILKAQQNRYGILTQTNSQELENANNNLVTNKPLIATVTNAPAYNYYSEIVTFKVANVDDLNYTIEEFAINDRGEELFDYTSEIVPIKENGGLL